MDDQTKRPTVTVMSALDRAVTIRGHADAAHPLAPRLPNGDDGITLQPGPNTGVDKEWFDRWLKDNAKLSFVEAGSITAVDEED